MPPFITSSAISTPMVWIDSLNMGTASTVPFYTNTYANSSTSTSQYANIWYDESYRTLNVTLAGEGPWDLYTNSGYINQYLQQWLVEQEDVTPQEYYNLAQGRITISRERVEAIMRARQEETQRRIEEAERHNQKARAAELRSRELLLAHLTKEQRKSFEQNNWFIVVGGKSKQRYKIRTRDYVGNVDLLNANDGVVTRFCAHCSGVPLHDHHLAQKLAIQYNEDEFLRVANRR